MMVMAYAYIKTRGVQSSCKVDTSIIKLSKHSAARSVSPW